MSARRSRARSTGRGRRWPSWRPRSRLRGRIPALADLVACLRGQTSRPVRTGLDLETPGIVAFEAVDDADLARIAAAGRGRRVVWAGSAGLAGALFEGMPAGRGAPAPVETVPGSAVLAVVGSPAASDQLDGAAGPLRLFRDHGRPGRPRASGGGRSRGARAGRRRGPLPGAARARAADLGGARARRRRGARARGRPAADRRRDRARGVRPCGPDHHRPDRRSRAGRAARATPGIPPG